MDYEEREELSEGLADVELYRGFSKDGKTYRAIANNEVVDKLDSGIYKSYIDYDTGQIYFIKAESTCDDIVELPSSEFSRILAEMKNFLKPETKAKFDEFGFIYKRSCLMEGPPGCGKTVIINRVIQEVVNNGGIVLLDPNPRDCEGIFEVLDSLQSEMTTLVVFEEFETHFERGVDGSITSLLDGETQKKNVMYLATTTHIERIPAKIKRPGRFSSVIHVGAPTAEARQFYLETKLGDDKSIPNWVEQTEGLTIDEVKETVLAVKCLDCKLEDVVERINSSRGESGAS